MSNEHCPKCQENTPHIYVKDGIVCTTCGNVKRDR